MKSMSIKGGLSQYTMFGEEQYRYMSEESPFGRKVKFLNKNGYELQLENARKYFKEGQVLTVKEIYVGISSSEVEFVEVPNKRFNTVLFCDTE